MRMSSLFPAVAYAVFAFAPAALAEETDYLAVLRDHYGRNKVSAVGDAMRLSAAEAAKFWPLYAEYERELRGLNESRLALLQDYAQSYSTMTNKKARELLGRNFTISAELLDLRRRYAEKLSNRLTPVVGARFAQVEGQLQLIMDSELAKRIPLIEATGETGEPQPSNEESAPGKEKAAAPNVTAQ